VSSGSADTKSPCLRTVSASPPGADSVNAGEAAPVRAAVTATVVCRIVKLPPTASMAAPMPASNSSSLAGTSVPILAQATDTERHAFQLLGAAIPLTPQ